MSVLVRYESLDYIDAYFRFVVLIIIGTKLYVRVWCKGVIDQIVIRTSIYIWVSDSVNKCHFVVRYDSLDNVDVESVEGITNLVEHPVQMKPFGKTNYLVFSIVMLEHY